MWLSPPAASRSGRTTSCVKKWERAARGRGGLLGRGDAPPASRSRSVFARRRSCSGCPGNPLSSLVGSVALRHARVAGPPGHPDPAPPFRPGALARPGLAPTRARSLSPRADLLERGRARPRAARRAGVAHDRAGRLPPTRSCISRVALRCSPRDRRSATWRFRRSAPRRGGGSRASTPAAAPPRCDPQRAHRAGTRSRPRQAARARSSRG